MTSVNTNVAALSALRNLQATNTALDKTQSSISTGLKIESAKDNAAYWSIATAMKSDNKALSTVSDALGLGAATVDTAYEGLTAAKDVLDEVKKKLTAATQSGVDRAAVQAEISALQDQLKSIAASSTFSGENWLSIDSSVNSYTDTKSVVSSFNTDAAGVVTVGTVDVSTKSVALYDAGADTGATGILDFATSLTVKVNGVDTALDFGGKTFAGNASTAGLSEAKSVAGTSTTAGAAVYKAGAFSTTNLKAGDTLSFQIALDGGTTFSTVSVKTTAANILSDTAFAAAINSALGAATPALGRNVNASASGGQILLTDSATGSVNSMTVKNVAVADGDGVTTTLVAVASGGVGVSLASAGTSVPVAAGGTTSGTATFAAVDFTNAKLGDQFSFSVSKINGAATETHTVAFALTAATDVDFVTKMNAALDAQFGSGVMVADITTGTLTITNMVAATVTDNSNVAISAMTVTDTDGVVSSTGGLVANENGTTVTGFDASTAAAAGKATMTFSAVTLDSDDSLTFEMSVDGAANASVTIDRARIEAALGVNSKGSIKTAAEFVTVLTAATSLLPAGVTATVNTDGDVEFASATSTGNSSVTISNAKAIGGTAGSDQAISVADIDITDAAMTALGADDFEKRTQAIKAYINVVNAALEKVTASAANLGAVAKRIDLQKDFVTNLMDTIEKGVSGLVDADMNEASTKLQALQVKQQLGVQALSIANQSAQNVLSLFQ